MGFESLVRNPCAIRIVTMLLLTVSDVDVALSVLFLLNLKDYFDVNIIFKTAFGLVLVGFFVYLLGICYFGPRQKDRVVDIVRKAMGGDGSQFVSVKYKRTSNGELVTRSQQDRWDESEAVIITLTTPIVPPNQNLMGVKRAIPNFASLDVEEVVDRGKFRDGLAAWGCEMVWTAAQISNAKNCCEMSHGVPLWRTAAYGFMAQPDASALCGIFNANALYSFTVGTFELTFGAMMLAYQIDVQTLLPLGVSLVAFSLSLANVIFDFSSVLTKIGEEEDKREAIKGRIMERNRIEKAKLTENKDRGTQAIRTKYEGKNNPATLLQKKAEMDAVARTYSVELETLNDQMLMEMEIELEAWHKLLQKEQELAKGLKPSDSGEDGGDISLQQARNDHSVIQDKIDLVKADSLKQIKDLDMDDKDFQKKMDVITESRKAKLQGLQDLKARLLMD